MKIYGDIRTAAPQSSFSQDLCKQNSHIRVLKLDKIVINNLIIIFNE